ncbi:hypothetical protein ACV1DW_22265 [Aeromonas hydrophila]
MGLTMRDIDGFIDAAINRLSSDGTTESYFYVDLRMYQQRITHPLINRCIELCNSRGLTASPTGSGGLSVTVNLHTCMMNSTQARTFSAALELFRSGY